MSALHKLLTLNMPRATTCSWILLAATGLSLNAQEQPTTAASTAPPHAETALADVSEQVWKSAQSSRDAAALAPLAGLPEGSDPGVQSLRSSLQSLEANLAKREAARSEKITKVNGELDAALAGPQTPQSLSKALKSAVELFLLSTDKSQVLHDSRIASLIEAAEGAAKSEEAAGHWLIANEIFYRLHVLLEEQGIYKTDVERVGARLAMIRLYMPEHFWKLRNDERLAAGETALPPFNALNQDYAKKQSEISWDLVRNSLVRSSMQHVDTRRMTALLLGGLDSIRTLITTDDLKAVFPGIAEEEARGTMLAFIDEQTARLSNPQYEAPRTALDSMVRDLLVVNTTTVKLPEQSLLHEFGNGAMAQLDDFSAIIWPDEVARFERMTQGQFRGVGIQIQYDEESNMIKVVTPLEGSPAQRAGVRMGDFIKKIDGQSAVGLGINDAVDLITGPENTPVSITVERKAGETAEEIEFPLRRAVIPVATVKGWKRVGTHEDEWDYFIDPANGIGYVRLLQFTEETTKELDEALKSMRNSPGGLNAMILDLRFNPGGLLNEAVSVSNRFVDHGTIVSTQGTVPNETREAEAGKAVLNKIPVAVLINEGSASASEIVSGAIRHYADRGDIKAVVVGQRSFGKGSVQNVWPMTANGRGGMLKLTTQYYKLPDGRVLHKRPGESVWGVEPHVLVDMLPEQVTDAIKLRQEADVLPLNDKGEIVQTATPPPDPAKLLTDGVDLQLQTALVLMQSQTAPEKLAQPHIN